MTFKGISTSIGVAAMVTAIALAAAQACAGPLARDIYTPRTLFDSGRKPLSGVEMRSTAEARCVNAPDRYTSPGCLIEPDIAPVGQAMVAP